MERTEIIDQLRKILVDDLFVALPPEEIQPDDELGSKVGLDSIGFIEFASIVSQRYGVEASEETLAQGEFRTLTQVSDLILKNQGGFAKK